MTTAATNPALRTQARYLAWRSVIRTVRQPIVIVPPLVFPLFLLAINASGLDAATNVPGFPADTYLAFALAFPFMQGSLFANLTPCRTTNKKGAVFNELPPLTELAELRSAVYGVGGKVFSSDYLKQLTPLSLAIW